jgi:NADH:ubiquinone oxidoreductase subunit H
MFHRALWLLVALIVTVCLGCDSQRSTPELLDLSDVSPRLVKSGDQMVVLGRDLPVGQVADARVLFVGSTSQPGKPASSKRSIEVTGARLTREGVEFHVDDALLARFCGDGEEAEHATFSGRIEVWLPSTGRLPVYGSLKGDVVIDFVPRRASQRVLQLREAAVRDTEELVGTTFSPIADGGGFAISQLAPESPLAQAGAKEGDLVLALDALTVLSRDDLRLRGDGKPAAIEVLRADEALLLSLPTDGFRSMTSTSTNLGLVLLGALFVAFALLAGPLAFWLRWLAFRVREALLSRRETSAVASILRTAGGFGSVGQARSVGPIFLLCVLAFFFATFPFIELRLGLPLDIPTLYLLSVTARLTTALLTGGWGTGVGIVRRRITALAWTLLSELPATLALAAALWTAGSFHVKDLVQFQCAAGLGFTDSGSQPWMWLAFRNPLLAALFGFVFVIALVEREDGEMQPADWVHLLLSSGLGAIVFFGGYGLPGTGTLELTTKPWLQLLGSAVFLFKSVAIALVVLVLRSALPRVRPQIYRTITPRLIAPFAVLSLGFTVLARLYPPLPAVERAAALVVLCGVGLVLLMLVVPGLSRRRPEFSERARVNPFL